MGIKWIVKKSDFTEIRKSVSKEADSKKLEQLKKEVIAILEKKDSQEYKKAIEYFEETEIRYSHLEKSISGDWIEKAGYGVGTVRIWRGKKYKKVSTNPVKWVRVFDKHDRGAATSMGKYIAQVKKCETVEELYFVAKLVIIPHIFKTNGKELMRVLDTLALNGDFAVFYTSYCHYFM